MEDLSLHILDIAENSIMAGAHNISITLNENSAQDLLTIEIGDDGKGMSGDIVEKVADPFYTSRTTRKVGLGLALFREAAAIANGSMEVQSTPDAGTTVRATFQLSHIDRKPLGNMVETITSLLCSSAEVNIRYVHIRDGNKMIFDSREIREELGCIPLNSIKGINVTRGYLGQEEETLAH
ncbi:MAG: ATP-binding protein [Bacteroidota bacterium]|jgi:anti-sigma regulatory factor (Ser/Thr protein kinase)